MVNGNACAALFNCEFLNCEFLNCEFLNCEFLNCEFLNCEWWMVNGNACAALFNCEFLNCEFLNCEWWMVSTWCFFKNVITRQPKRLNGWLKCYAFEVICLLWALSIGNACAALFNCEFLNCEFLNCELWMVSTWCFFKERHHETAEALIRWTKMLCCWSDLLTLSVIYWQRMCSAF